MADVRGRLTHPVDELAQPRKKTPALRAHAGHANERNGIAVRQETLRGTRAAPWVGNRCVKRLQDKKRN
eukprot:9561530-Lingulodinium_polyedra.AAC.1